MTSLYAQMLTTMELFVEQRKWQQQLQDEVASIKDEVEEIWFLLAFPSPNNSTTMILDAASSPRIQRMVFDLNSPLGPPEVENDRKESPNMKFLDVKFLYFVLRSIL